MLHSCKTETWLSSVCVHLYNMYTLRLAGSFWGKRRRSGTDVLSSSRMHLRLFVNGMRAQIPGERYTADETTEPPSTLLRTYSSSSCMPPPASMTQTYLSPIICASMRHEDRITAGCSAALWREAQLHYGGTASAQVSIAAVLTVAVPLSGPTSSSAAVFTRSLSSYSSSHSRHSRGAMNKNGLIDWQSADFTCVKTWPVQELWGKWGWVGTSVVNQFLIPLVGNLLRSTNL